MLDGHSRRGGPSFDSCCGAINFFSSNENALAYLLAHPELDGQSITLPEAIEAATAVFGDLDRPRGWRLMPTA